MFTKSQELKRFQTQKIKICQLKSDIWFLTKCKKFNVFPRFIDNGIKCSIKNKRSNDSVKKAKYAWLRNELKQKFALLQTIELDTYKLHRTLANQYTPLIWNVFDTKLLVQRFLQSVMI